MRDPNEEWLTTWMLLAGRTVLMTAHAAPGTESVWTGVACEGSYPVAHAAHTSRSMVASELRVQLAAMEARSVRETLPPGVGGDR